jgi:hypothetical protein
LTMRSWTVHDTATKPHGYAQGVLRSYGWGINDACRRHVESGELYRPGGEYGPSDDENYAAKLKGGLRTRSTAGPTYSVREVGEPEALGDLVDLSTVIGTLPCPRCRTGEHPRTVRLPASDDRRRGLGGPPGRLAPLQADDSAGVTTRMGRGLLVVRIEPTPAVAVDAIVCHLKSKC